MTTAAELPAPSRGFVSKAPKLGFIGGFDGIRGWGVMLVLIEHALAPTAREGFTESWAVIVDVFFVLSAFLIVSLLMQEYRSTGTINMRKFYARRAIRLLPSVYLCFAAWMVLGAIEAAFDLVPDVNLFSEVIKDVLAGFFYVYHWIFPVGAGLIHPELGARPMGQFWSLSVEEQFYLVVAVTTLFAIRRNLVKVLGVLCLLGWLWVGWQRLQGRTGPVMSGDGAPGLLLMWMNRPDGLLLGVALAVFNAYLTPEAALRWRRTLIMAATIGYAVWFSVSFLSSHFLHEVGERLGIGLPYVPYAPEARIDDVTAAGYQTAQQYVDTNLGPDGPMWFWRFGHSLSHLAIAPVLLCVARYPDWWVNRLWSWAPFRRIGRMSYTLYVWHTLPYLIIIGMTAEMSRSQAFIIRFPILIASAFLVAWPVYNKVETRVLDMKLRFSSEKEALDLNTGRMVQVGDSGGVEDSPGASDAPAATDEDTPDAPRGPTEADPLR